MKKNVLINYKYLALFLFFCLTAPFMSVPDADAQITAQERLLARRAAKVDALRNLAEIVYGVQITSSTTVRDFVTQSDTVRARLDALMRGAEEVDYIERPDGTAEVTIEITLGRVQDILGRRLNYNYETFSATGYGVPSGGVPATTTSSAPDADYLRAKGYGVEPDDPAMSPVEKALMGKRAAKIDAMRNLTEQIMGVRITSDSVVQDFVTQSDDTRARVNDFIRGATVISEKKLPDGSYEVEIEVEIVPLRNIFR